MSLTRYTVLYLSALTATTCVALMLRQWDAPGYLGASMALGFWVGTLVGEIKVKSSE